MIMDINTSIPQIESLSSLGYIGIRSQVFIGTLASVIPKHIDESMDWLSGKGITPIGPPIIRYHMCPTVPSDDAPLEVCIGWPVSDAIMAESPFVYDVLPEGKYASLVYEGIENGIAGNEALIAWARNNGIIWDSWEVTDGDGFFGRVEHLLDGPEDDPDPSKWRTKVSIMIKE
jgi:effector-binding domain-containing protein